MAPKPRTVTAKALQALLTRIGSASSGTKDVLLTRLERDMRQRRLFALRPDWEQRLSHSDERFRNLRIMSIDMGIKNLAYCHVAVGYPNGDSRKPTMHIERWDKLNLVPATRDLRRHLPKPQSIKEGTAGADEEVDPYSLSVLSQTAYWFIHNTALELAPDIILIERQRWRSASSAAIQQWTVRVNTLEAMLWAILETLRKERLINIYTPQYAREKRDYEIYGVDPKRVGQYWLGQHAKAADEKQDEAVMALAADEESGGKAEKSKKMPRSKAEKKAKIALLRSWLSTEPASTATSTPNLDPTISFTIGESAVTARRALCLPTPRHARKKKSKAIGENDDGEADDVQERDMKKLDDITDCFLQAAAWVAWESNRLQLFEAWEGKRTDNGQMPPLDENILREMIEVAGEG
jgi:cruciform cutting endonuclease 1